MSGRRLSPVALKTFVSDNYSMQPHECHRLAEINLFNKENCLQFLVVKTSFLHISQRF
jgi:hypothetical protein